MMVACLCQLSLQERIPETPPSVVALFSHVDDDDDDDDEEFESVSQVTGPVSNELKT